MLSRFSFWRAFHTTTAMRPFANCSAIFTRALIWLCVHNVSKDQRPVGDSERHTVVAQCGLTLRWVTFF